MFINLNNNRLAIDIQQCFFLLCSFFIISFLSFLLVFIIYTSLNKQILAKTRWLLRIKFMLYFYSILVSLCIFFVTFVLFLNVDTPISLLSGSDLLTPFQFNMFPCTNNLQIWNSSFFILNKFNLLFLLLFATLFPVVIFFLTNDYSIKSINFFFYLVFIMIFSYLLVLCNNIILFYFLYELLLILIFNVMYLSSNARGGIEAALFYAGWALFGSILVGVGFLYLIQATNQLTFSALNDHSLTSQEIYFVYLLFFFGFGTKLSTWPFWYWLPRAHVEVSTGMSIFLSCILIKIAYFGLLKMHLSLGSEISYNICISVGLICVFDIVFRVINLKDLKALIAYSSVLHTNLLIILIHVDLYKVIGSSWLYIWGHSLATTNLFMVVFLIESHYNSRNILQVNGLWQLNPLLAYLTFWSLLSFLDLPCSLFFWGEFWLWLLFFEKFFWLSIFIFILCNVIFISIFFKFWWGILFGTPPAYSKTFKPFFNFEVIFLIIVFNIFQLICGLQPSIITSLVCLLY